MRRPLILALIAQAALVAGLGLALRAEGIPLGVPGQWQWPRLRAEARTGAADLAPALVAIAAYAALAAWGRRSLARGEGRLREGAWVAGLAAAAVGLQVAVLSGAPAGFGLTKWVTLALPGSSGYYQVARARMHDPRRFWAEYPRWIRDQDALHIGTHPPGLLLLTRAALGLMEARPAAARWVDAHAPGAVRDGFRQIVPLPRADRAAVILIGALTLLACATTVAPLYVLARGAGTATEAWASAVLWPLVPAAILFQPTADTAFPLLSTSALALATWGTRRPSGPALATGLLLGLGMMFSLVFLAVGLIVALLELTAPGTDCRRRSVRLAATGAGFLAFTLATWAVSGANPFVIWWWNQANHARFYDEFPRDYVAWVLANPVELAAALGPPVAVWAAIGLSLRKVPRVAWVTLAVLAVLDLSGRNLSEVARLWLPLMPPLLVAAGSGLSRLGAGPLALATTVALLGLQTLIMQALIQVVYPGVRRPIHVPRRRFTLTQVASWWLMPTFSRSWRVGPHRGSPPPPISSRRLIVLASPAAAPQRWRLPAPPRNTRERPGRSRAPCGRRAAPVLYESSDSGFFYSRPRKGAHDAPARLLARGPLRGLGGTPRDRPHRLITDEKGRRQFLNVAAGMISRVGGATYLPSRIVEIDAPNSGADRTAPGGGLGREPHVDALRFVPAATGLKRRLSHDSVRPGDRRRATLWIHQDLPGAAQGELDIDRGGPDPPPHRLDLELPEVALVGAAPEALPGEEDFNIKGMMADRRYTTEIAIGKRRV
jgi:hypothetical protein